MGSEVVGDTVLDCPVNVGPGMEHTAPLLSRVLQSCGARSSSGDGGSVLERLAGRLHMCL